MARGQDAGGIDTTTAAWRKEALTFQTPGENYCTRIRILRRSTKAILEAI